DEGVGEGRMKAPCRRGIVGLSSASGCIARADRESESPRGRAAGGPRFLATSTRRRLKKTMVSGSALRGRLIGQNGRVGRAAAKAAHQAARRDFGSYRGGAVVVRRLRARGGAEGARGRAGAAARDGRGRGGGDGSP